MIRNYQPTEPTPELSQETHPEFLHAMGEADLALVPYRMLISYQGSAKDKVILAILYSQLSDVESALNQNDTWHYVPYEVCVQGAATSKAVVTRSVRWWGQVGVLELSEQDGWLSYRFVPGPHNWNKVPDNVLR